MLHDACEASCFLLMPLSTNSSKWSIYLNSYWWQSCALSPNRVPLSFVVLSICRCWTFHSHVGLLQQLPLLGTQLLSFLSVLHWRNGTMLTALSADWYHLKDLILPSNGYPMSFQWSIIDMLCFWIHSRDALAQLLRSVWRYPKLLQVSLDEAWLIEEAVELIHEHSD